MALAHDRAGSGAPLLLVHSLGGTRAVWSPVLPYLIPHRDVIAVDMPGFGDSAPLAGVPTPRALAAALATLLDELGLARAHLAGNSLGGWVALELERLGRAESVTAIAPAGLWPAPLGDRPGPDLRAAACLARPLVPLMVRSGRLRRAALSGVTAHPERVPAADAGRLIAGYLRAPGFEAANAAMRSAVFTPRPSPTPVTLAWPEHDRLVARPRRLPAGWRSVTLRGTGHVPMWDDPHAVARVILERSADRSETTTWS